MNGIKRNFTTETELPEMLGVQDHGITQNRTNKVALARALLNSRYKPHAMRVLPGAACDFQPLSARKVLNGD